MIRIGILGYGNLGKGTELAIKQNPDMEIGAIFTRRNPEDIQTEGGNYLDIIVPEGYVFAMGDNREHSTDCREFGCIPVEKIESKVVMRFWPLNKFGKVK